MSKPKIVSREKWIKARKKFLAREKKFTRLRDKLAKERRKLPWEPVTKKYVFEGAKGKESLADLFGGKSQFIVYHFMFAPDWEAGCRGCSFWADNFNNIIVHLNQRDTNLVTVSRAPYKKLAAYRKRMGWNFKWVSSGKSDFNYDFGASFTDKEVKKKKAFFNFTMQDPFHTDREGTSVFTKDKKGRIFRTYSTFARGIDLMNTAYNYLDITPKGRDEGKKGPYWVRRHDEYGT
jgi:predicted dithiol-disulfide oxidoreductase (DUF899 family)